MKRFGFVRYWGRELENDLKLSPELLHTYLYLVLKCFRAENNSVEFTKELADETELTVESMNDRIQRLFKKGRLEIAEEGNRTYIRVARWNLWKKQKKQKIKEVSAPVKPYHFKPRIVDRTSEVLQSVGSLISNLNSIIKNEDIIERAQRAKLSFFTDKFYYVMSRKWQIINEEWDRIFDRFFEKCPEGLENKAGYFIAGIVDNGQAKKGYLRDSQNYK